LETGHVYKVRVRQNVQALVGSLKQINGIAHVHTTGVPEEVEFAVTKQASEQIIDDVAKRVLDGGFGLKELTLKARSLEEVFMQLTK
jgi:hypothetical protein